VIISGRGRVIILGQPGAENMGREFEENHAENTHFFAAPRRPIQDTAAYQRSGMSAAGSLEATDGQSALTTASIISALHITTVTNLAIPESSSLPRQHI
jgi:hypothetical protein